MIQIFILKKIHTGVYKTLYSLYILSYPFPSFHGQLIFP